MKAWDKPLTLRLPAEEHEAIGRAIAHHRKHVLKALGHTTFSDFFPRLTKTDVLRAGLKLLLKKVEPDGVPASPSDAPEEAPLESFVRLELDAAGNAVADAVPFEPVPPARRKTKARATRKTKLQPKRRTAKKARKAVRR